MVFFTWWVCWLNCCCRCATAVSCFWRFSFCQADCRKTAVTCALPHPRCLGSFKQATTGSTESCSHGTSCFFFAVAACNCANRACATSNCDDAIPNTNKHNPHRQKRPCMIASTCHKHSGRQNTTLFNQEAKKLTNEKAGTR